MKTYHFFCLVLFSVFATLFSTQPVYATPSQQADDPVEQCAKGFEFFLEDKYAEALPLLEEGFDGREETYFTNPEDLGYCALALGIMRRLAGNPNGALEAYQVALPIFRASHNRKVEGTTLNNIGGVYHAQGRYAQALDYYQQAMTIAREVGDWAGEGATLNNIGGIYNEQGQYTKALDYFQQALTIAREVGNRKGEGATINNIGSVYQSKGQYTRALDYLQQALAIRQEVGDRAGEGATLNNIGGVYNEQGQYAQALNYYLQALTIRREVGDRMGEGMTLNNLGLFYDHLGQYEQALDYYQQALTLEREVGDQTGQGTTLNNIGAIYKYQTNYEKALEYLQQALIIRREIGDRAGEGTTLSNLGEIYFLQGQYEQALEYYQQALIIEREVGDRDGEGKTLDGTGLVYYYQGQYARALEYFQQSIAVSEEIRATAGNDTARASFIAQYAVVYQSAAAVAHQLQQDRQAFAFSEQGRARSFLDALTTGTVELSDQPAAELINREQETYAGWLAAQNTLAKAKAQSPLDNALISDLEAQLTNAEQAHTETLQSIEARDDELAALVPGRSTVLSLDEVQNLLNDQTTLISYFVIDEDSGTLAFIITRNSFSVVELPNATPTKLKTTVEGIFPSLQNAHSQPLQDLYAWLIAPINDQIKTPRVGIIPHLTLHYIPLAALSDGQTYLGEQYQLFELPSASSLRYIQQHAAQATNNGAVVFGNPTTNETGLSTLPYAAAEAETVATTLGVSGYTDTNATELQLRESISGKAVLHLAVHGSYNQFNPLYSTLYLAPDSNGQYDGRLEVHEIFGLDLKGSQLVVLSACETQLGQLSTGDEVVGMTRAFMFAGTPSVLASLWQVDDEATQVLMTSFYKHWREDGMNKAQALQAAQADVRANPKWKSPYYWAAFVLNGDIGTTSMQATTTDAPSNPICSNAMLAPVVFIFGIFTIKRHPLHKGIK